MAAKKKVKAKAKAKVPEPTRSVGGRILTGLATLVILLFIAYAGIRLIATTDGFRYYIQEHLTERWSYPVSIDSSRLTAKLDLELGGIAGGTEISEDGWGGFYLDTVTIDFNHSRDKEDNEDWIRSIQVMRPEINFEQDEKGDWHPAFLYAPWQALMNFTGLKAAAEKGTPLVSDPSAYAAEQFDTLPRLHLVDGNVAEDTTDQLRSLVLDEVEVMIHPLEIPGRSLHYMRIHSKMGGLGKARYRNMQLEWFGGDQVPSILDNRIEWDVTIQRPKRDPKFSTPEGRETIRYYLQQQAEAREKPPSQSDVEAELKDALKNP